MLQAGTENAGSLQLQTISRGYDMTYGLPILLYLNTYRFASAVSMWECVSFPIYDVVGSKC